MTARHPPSSNFIDPAGLCSWTSHEPAEALRARFQAVEREENRVSRPTSFLINNALRRVRRGDRRSEGSGSGAPEGQPQRLEIASNSDLSTDFPRARVFLKLLKAFKSFYDLCKHCTAMVSSLIKGRIYGHKGTDLRLKGSLLL